MRGIVFVTRNISHGVARIKLGLADTLELGNIDARRDWGHAADYVRAMWLLLQQDEPDDHVIATGRGASVREFARLAFARVGLVRRTIMGCGPMCCGLPTWTPCAAMRAKLFEKRGWRCVLRHLPKEARLGPKGGGT